ncbi:unnamed protein product [Amoebophrya sp. A120]|nr:unnamed protein product [Amoebophrya sp. A120]|eukprot:GSA120T00018045001.1
MRASAPTSRNPASCSIRVLYGLCGEEREFEFPLQKLDHEKNGEEEKHFYEAPLVRALLDKVARVLCKSRILCKSIVLVVIPFMHYKFFSQGKSAFYKFHFSC